MAHVRELFFNVHIFYVSDIVCCQRRSFLTSFTLHDGDMIPVSPAKALVVKRSSTHGLAHFRSFRSRQHTDWQQPTNSSCRPDYGANITEHPLHRSEGIPRTGYLVLACVGSGSWADFESCSRIGACAFLCFCRKVCLYMHNKTCRVAEKLRFHAGKPYLLRESSVYMHEHVTFHRNVERSHIKAVFFAGM